MAKIEEQPGQVTFVQAIKNYFKGYVDFKGRTTRAGYWWMALLLSIMYIVLTIFALGRIFAAAFSLIENSYLSSYQFNQQFYSIIESSLGSIILLVVVALATVLPTLALAIRRYRDAGFRGRGFAILFLVNFFSSFLFGDGSIPITSAISIFSLVLCLLPTDSLTTTSSNGFVQFFLRPKVEAKQEELEF